MSLSYCGLKHKVQGRTAQAARPVNGTRLTYGCSTEYPTVSAICCVHPINPQPSPITRPDPSFSPPTVHQKVLDWGLSWILDVRTRKDVRTHVPKWVYVSRLFIVSET